MPTDFRQGRRLVRFRSTLATLLAIALVIVANLLSVRLNYHGYLSRSFNLVSPRTDALLRSTEGDIEIVNFLESSHPVHDRLDKTLTEFSEATKNLPNLRLEIIDVDPGRDAAEAAEIIRRHNAPPNSLIIRSRTEKSDRIIPADDLIDFQRVRDDATHSNLLFVAEDSIASGIWNVSHSSRPVVYFLAGYGTYDPDDTNPHSGYSAIAQVLKRDLYEVRTLDLYRETAIPQTESVLVIAGPRIQFPIPVIETLDRYLEAGGRLLLLRGDGADPGLRGLVERWGVRMGRRDTPRTGLRAVSEVTTIANVVTNALPVFGARVGSLSPLPETRGADLAADKPRSYPLLLRPDDSADPETTNELAVAIAVERGSQSRTPGTTPTRLVVVDDSEFASNALCGDSGFAANRDFFLACVHWLSEHEVYTGSSRNVFRYLRSGIGHGQWSNTILLVVAAWPALILLLGWLLFHRRS